MIKLKYIVRVTTTFKKEYKLAKRRGLNIALLKQIVSKLAYGETLPEQNQDHALRGEWIGYRECHILNDWLLIYRIDDDVMTLTLTHTGTHSDLFGK